MMSSHLFGRCGHRAGGEHQKRDGDANGSTHEHQALSPCVAHPSAKTSDRAATPMVLVGPGMEIGVVPDCCRSIRVGQGGTAPAKPGKTQMSTPPLLYALTMVFPPVVGSAKRQPVPADALFDHEDIITSGYRNLFQEVP